MSEMLDTLANDLDEDEEILDRQILDYEPKFMKKQVVPESKPRLYCLSINGTTVDYEEEEEKENDNKTRRETPQTLYKEICNFKQKSLEEKGQFLLDFGSEAFVWVG